MRETIIREAVAASPDKVAIIFVKGHPEKDGPGASRFATTDQNGWDHVAAAWQDKDGNLVFRDMTPSKALVGPYQDDLGGAEGKRGIFGSKNGAITLDTLVQAYPEVLAIPLEPLCTIWECGPGADCGRSGEGTGS